MRLAMFILALSPTLSWADAFFVNTDRIKQVAQQAVETELPNLELIPADSFGHTLVSCFNSTAFAQANFSQQEAFERCKASKDFWIVDSIVREPDSARQNGKCGVRVHYESVSVTVFADGTYRIPEVAGRGSTLQWEDCSDQLQPAKSEISP